MDAPTDALDETIYNFVARQGAAFENQIAVSVGVSISEAHSRLGNLVEQGLLIRASGGSGTAIYTPNLRRFKS